MKFGPKLTQGLLWFLAAGLSGAASAQTAPQVAPVPRGAFEVAAGPIENAETVAQRDAAVKILSKGRNSYALRNYRQAWDLKVRFTVESGGQTSNDGAWEMEDIFSPGQGLHWTAKSAAGYSITGIFGASQNYAEATTSVAPLRLQEARAMLYNPLPSIEFANRGSIRTVSSTLGSTPVVCVLLSPSRAIPHPLNQRAWGESEDCFDPQSGLLQMHSEIPGRYAVYDYRNPARLGSHELPGVITVTEAGRVVSTVSVISLQAIPAADSALFVPTPGMQKAGPPVAMNPSLKITRIHGQAIAGAVSLRPVYVFGLLTPEGHLVEAHSLQPSDPNSDAAVRDAQAINFSPSMKPGAPQQRFVFVLEEFASAQ